MDKEKFLSVAESYYEEFASLPEAENFYDYEKSFVEMFQRMARDCMEKQLNATSSTSDRRKKKR